MLDGKMSELRCADAAWRKWRGARGDRDQVTGRRQWEVGELESWRNGAGGE